MDDNVKAKFDGHAEQYDMHRRKFIPDFDGFYDTGINFLVCGELKPRALDLGAGTGLYTEFLLKRYPQAEVTLVDFSDKMLEQARSRFAERENVSYICADYANLLAIGLPMGSFDIVISALSIHHFANCDKQRVYGDIAKLLKPGGEFLNSDEIAGESSRLDKRFVEIWHNFVRGNTSAQEFEEFLNRTSIDIRASVSEQLEWLRGAGFQADCVFKSGLFAVMYGLLVV